MKSITLNASKELFNVLWFVKIVLADILVPIVLIPKTLDIIL